MTSAPGTTFCCRKKSENEIPIDKGWAWVIALACSGLLGLIAGTFKCFGLLKLAIEEAFPEFGEENVLWVLSVCSIVSLISGPIFSSLLLRTSHRTVAMVGGFLCTAGLAATAFAPYGEFLFFSFSVVYAAGAGGIVMVVFTAFSDYFVKHKGLAVGIVGSGSGFGGFVISKLFGFLFDRFTFKSALIIYAVVFLQSVVLAALLRPVSYYSHKEMDKFDSPNRSSQTISTDEERDDEHEDMQSNEIESAENGDGGLCGDSSMTNELDNNNKSMLLPPSHDAREPEYTQEIFGTVYSSLASPFVSTVTLDELVYSNKQATTKVNTSTSKTSSPALGHLSSSLLSWCKLWCKSQVLLIGAILFCAFSSINLIFTLTPSFAEENGVDVNTVTTIMTVTGVVEIVFRLFQGWIVDRKIFCALTQTCIIMLVCALAAILCATLPAIYGVSVIYTAMAMCGTTIISLLPVLIIEQVGKEHLVTVLGICNVYQGAAFIVSTLVANKLKSAFQSWSGVFFYVFACYIMAALIGTTILVYRKVTERRTRSRAEAVVIELT